VTIRKPDLTDSERSALFWLNLTLGATLSAVVASVGFLFAAFFHEPALRLLLPAMAVSFIINGAHTQLRAQLVRDHRFTELNRIEALAFTSSTAIAIGLAWLGAGSWALVSLVLSSEVAIAIGVWAKQSWRPETWRLGLGAAHLLRSGAGLSANDGLRYAQRNVDLFLVGRWFGAGALGVYGRAAQMASLPTIYVGDPLSNLAVSSLRHLSGSPAEAREFWRRLLNSLAWIAVPAAVAFACFPSEIIVVLLGARWASGATILRGLSVGLLALPVGMGCGWVFLAAGPSRRLLAWSSLATALPVAACLLLRTQGTTWIALGMGATSLASSLAGLAFIGSRDIVRPGDAVLAMVRPIASGLVLSALLLLSARLTPGQIPVHRILIAGVAGGTWAAAMWTCWPAVRQEWRQHFLWRRQ
jgi:PST family polysaccharide transporter